MITALVILAALQPSIELGQRITRPAEVAGPWETLVAPAEVAFISLQIITTAGEKVHFLRLDTYVRKNGKTQSTYWMSGEPGSFLMRNGRVQLHQTRTANGGFDVALNLTYDPNDQAWKGSFSDPFFSGEVALRRPKMSDALAPAGTWRTYSDTVVSATARAAEYGCTNIGVGQDGALVLWAEFHHISLSIFDQSHNLLYGDSYGNRYDDAHATRYADEWSFIAGNPLSGDRVTGTMSSDGTAFGGYYSEHYGNGEYDPSHPRRAFAWTRMPNLACRP